MVFFSLRKTASSAAPFCPSCSVGKKRLSDSVISEGMLHVLVPSLAIYREHA